jgi:uncharacterized protein (UPF0335 family)
MGHNEKATAEKFEAEKSTIVEQVAEIINLTQDKGVDNAYMLETSRDYLFMFNI